VSKQVIEEVAYGTPGFSGWQQERWWTHCGDAAEFLGPKGLSELQALGSDAVEAIQTDTGLSGAAWENYFRSLDRNGSPTAYVFRCRHCGAFGGYQDCH
jgi:hypothetical protein